MKKNHTKQKWIGIACLLIYLFSSSSYAQNYLRTQIGFCVDEQFGTGYGVTMETLLKKKNSEKKYIGIALNRQEFLGHSATIYGYAFDTYSLFFNLHHKTILDESWHLDKQLGIGLMYMKNRRIEWLRPAANIAFSLDWRIAKRFYFEFPIIQLNFTPIDFFEEHPYIQVYFPLVIGLKIPINK